ncbi:GNAT family N-acetyltransferase [Pararobbsia silviterrae]|nr:GNAT family N-acetyltransferase [Pararobbsia silviterrae]
MQITLLCDVPRFLPAVAKALHETFWLTDPEASIERAIDRLSQRLNAHALPFTLVAHDRDTLLGTGSVLVNEVPEDTVQSAWLSAVWVDEAHRGRGVGAAIVDACCAHARRLGEPALLLMTADEREFYERRGWTVIDAIAEPTVVMRRNLRTESAV